MQFGRIDANAYTLDFQYPLTAIQVMVMVEMMMMVVVMMIVMTKPSLIIIGGVGQTWTHNACVAPSSRFRVVLRDEPS